MKVQKQRIHATSGLFGKVQFCQNKKFTLQLNNIIYLDQMYESNGNGTDINNSCIFEPSPSERNEMCQEFKHIMGESQMPKPGEAIVIDLGNNNSTRCYGPSKAGAGWCGACNNLARRGPLKHP